MTHWRAVLPAGVMIEFDCEAALGDPAGQARRLVASCGLEWDEACQPQPSARPRSPAYEAALAALGTALELPLGF